MGEEEKEADPDEGGDRNPTEPRVGCGDSCSDPCRAAVPEGDRRMLLMGGVSEAIERGWESDAERQRTSSRVSTR